MGHCCRGSDACAAWPAPLHAVVRSDRESRAPLRRGCRRRSRPVSLGMAWRVARDEPAREMCSYGHWSVKPCLACFAACLVMRSFAAGRRDGDQARRMSKRIALRSTPSLKSSTTPRILFVGSQAVASVGAMMTSSMPGPMNRLPVSAHAASPLDEDLATDGLIGRDGVLVEGLRLDELGLRGGSPAGPRRRS